MLTKKIVAALILCFFISGCSTIYYVRFPEGDILPEGSRNIQLQELKEFYNYKSNLEELEICLIKETPRFKICRIKFPFDLKGLFPGKNFVEFEYYLPKKEEGLPAVVILPHLAGSSGLESFFSKGLVRNNFAVLEIGEPYFTKDRKEGKWWMHQLQKEEDLEKIKLLFRQLVIDTRRAVDFLEVQPEIDQERIGILGLSLGGCLAVLVAGIDRRIGAATLILSGGDLVTLIRESAYAEILRKHMEKGNINFKSMGERWPEIEPLVLAPYLKGRPVLMVNATFDHLMPYTCTKKLWQSLNTPRIIWIPSGHYGSVVFLSYARRETVRYFTKHLIP